MSVKVLKSLSKVGLLIFITLITVYATGIITVDKEIPVTNYSNMSMTKLQKEVEKRSNNGALPFSMGTELIHRWSNPKL